MTEPVVFVETSRDLPLVSLTVASRTGAAGDPPGVDGLSRFAARLMRRTAGGRTATQVDATVDAMGGALAVDAATSSVSISGTVIRRSLDAFVDVVADVVTAPAFQEDELERLRRETLAELEDARDDDQGLARRWFRRTLFAGHPYGRSLSGSPQSIGSITPRQVAERHRALFARDNLVFAFAGDIAEDEARSIADRIAARAASGPAAEDDVPHPTVRSGRHLLVVDKPQRTQTQILIGTLGTHAHDPDHTALHVANTIFGGTFTARLTREVRSKRGWSYGAYSTLAVDRRRQALALWTFPKTEDAGPCITLELELLEAWRERGVTEEEVASAKSYLTKSHAFAVDTASKRVAQDLEEELLGLPKGYHSGYVDRVRSVTAAEASAAVARRIDHRDLLVTIVGTATELGDGPVDAIANLASRGVVSYLAD